MSAWLALASSAFAEDGKSTPATTGPVPGYEKHWPFMMAQVPLLDAADELAPVAKAIAPYDDTIEGFGAIELDVPNNTLFVYWKRNVEIPAEIKEKIAYLRDAYKIEIEVKDAPLSKRDVKALQNYFRGKEKFEYLDLLSVESLPKSQGLRLVTHKKNLEKLQKEALYLEALSQMTQTQADGTALDCDPTLI